MPPPPRSGCLAGRIGDCGAPARQSLSLRRADAASSLRAARDPRIPFRSTIDWTRVHVDERPAPPTTPRATAWRTARSWRTCRFQPARSTACAGSLPTPRKPPRIRNDSERAGRNGSLLVTGWSMLDFREAALLVAGRSGRMPRLRKPARGAIGRRGVWVNQLNAWRITLTPSAIARCPRDPGARVGSRQGRRGSRRWRAWTCGGGPRSCSARRRPAWNGL